MYSDKFIDLPELEKMRKGIELKTERIRALSSAEELKLEAEAQEIKKEATRMRSQSLSQSKIKQLEIGMNLHDISKEFENVSHQKKINHPKDIILNVNVFKKDNSTTTTIRIGKSKHHLDKKSNTLPSRKVSVQKDENEIKSDVQNFQNHSFSSILDYKTSNSTQSKNILDVSSSLQNKEILNPNNLAHLPNISLSNSNPLTTNSNTPSQLDFNNNDCSYSSGQRLNPNSKTISPEIRKKKFLENHAVNFSLTDSQSLQKQSPNIPLIRRSMPPVFKERQGLREFLLHYPSPPCSPQVSSAHLEIQSPTSLNYNRSFHKLERKEPYKEETKNSGSLNSSNNNNNNNEETDDAYLEQLKLLIQNTRENNSSPNRRRDTIA